jgi:glycosyltransferase involved in cell wall biosynthesis
MRLCIIGGSPSHPGGLEAYCDRAVEAFHLHAGNVTVAHFPTEAAYVGQRGLAGMRRCATSLVRRRRDFDVAWVHVSSLAECLFVPLARLLGWRVMITPHLGGTSRQEVRRSVRWPRLALMGRAHAAGLLFAGQEREISLPSHLTRDVVGTFLPLETFTATPSRASSDRPLHLIHAARFSIAKGTFLMLDLCERLKASEIPFSARLVGRADDATMAGIARRIEAADLSEQVQVTDWLDTTGITQALRDADVLVHLSSIDSFPLIVLEALAAGALPIVRPMAGSLSMVQELGGFCAGFGAGINEDATDPVSAAFSWLATADLAELRREGSEAAERTRAAYSWPTVVGKALSALGAVRRRAR